VVEKIQLTKEEITILKQHFRKSQKPLIRERSQAALSFSRGIGIYEISIVLMRSEKTIREWIKEFQRRRIASLFPSFKGENAAKLTRSQKQQLQTVLSSPPSDYGIPTKFWDISALKTYVKAEFGVEYESDESYRLIFKLHRYSFHLPDVFDVRRNDKTIAKRMREIQTEIKPFMENDAWIVFASDESRIIWETLTRRLWLPKGKKTIIKVQRKRQAQSFIGFLNLKTGEDLLYRLSWQKQDTIIPVLEELIRKYPDKSICIIWDNARFHHGKKIKQALSRSLKTIHLINLPPYAPDHNPQEHVWKYGKDKLSNNQRESIEETATAFESIITGRNYPYRI